jgi:hypothetical protein
MVLRYRGTRVACNGVAIKEGWCRRAMAGLLVADEGEDRHLGSAVRTGQRVDIIDPV